MIGSPRLSYHQGDHVYTLFASPQEQLQAAVEYIQGGLARGERCLYVCCEHELDEFRAALRQARIDVDLEEKRGALVLLTKRDGHLKGGSFDPDRMLEMLDQAVKEALQAGFAGLCAAGDMNWLLDNAPGSEKLAEYEARLNLFYEKNHALGLCLYNLGSMPPEALDDCLATHPYVRVEGPILLSNPFYELPEKAMRRIADPRHAMKKVQQIRSTRT